MDGISINAGAMAAKFESRMRTVTARVQELGSKAVQAQAKSVRQAIVATSPVDTGRLRDSWSQATQSGGALTWRVSTDVPYAAILEYGGYTRTGPRTVHVGGGDLGAGFVAGTGIYSTQAPLGFVRKALAGAAPQLRLRLRNVLAQAWGGLGEPGNILGMQEAESIFGLEFGPEPAGTFAVPIGMEAIHGLLRELGFKEPRGRRPTSTRLRGGFIGQPHERGTK